MIHIDLFSGIGGFALATEMVWDNVEHIFCDNDPFAQEILKKHWPNSTIYGDIKELTTKRFTNDTISDKYRTEQREIRETEGVQIINRSKVGSRWIGGTDCILTGGFPCQPFSQAGRRKGTEDDRYLWPEMLRVIREFNPRWVIAENVGGLVTWSGGMVLEQVHVDLESEGYEVQAFIIPAVAVNAPHRRDRVWFVARSVSSTDRGAPRQNSSTSGEERVQERDKVRKSIKSANVQISGNERWRWSQDWLEIATELCRVDDGVPKRLDRNPRLKGLGNAIVPQVAAQIMQAIKLADNN
jgi:DNA (cytosine-5)-methyltransferase 1